MPEGGKRGQNLGHRFFIKFFVIESLVFEQQILFRVDSLRLATSGFSAPGEARGQNLEHIKIFFYFFAFDFL